MLILKQSHTKISLISLSTYSEGFRLVSKTKIYEYCLVRKTISAYDKIKKVDVYESRCFETNNNRSKGDVSW